MRTGIYAYNPTTLTIQGSETLDVVSLDGMTNKQVNQSGSVQVPAGIYKVISTSTVTVTGTGIEVITMEDKDPWPDPLANVVNAFNVTTSILRDFFVDPNAKGMTAI